MSDKVFTLPSKEEILERLMRVNDDSHIVHGLYPRLTKNGGQEKAAMGVVIMLQLAFYDYTRGMPATMVAILNMQMDDFIDALCPDAEIAAEAKAIFKEAMAAQ